MKTRDESWALLTEHLKTDYLLKHLLAAEVCMKALAARLGGDEATWAAAGLMHDLDLDIVQADPARHGLVTAEILTSNGYGDEIVHAVLAHAGHKPPETTLEKALVAVDPTTGFIVAAVLVRPDKKIEGLEARSVRKRMKEKRFAANVDRDQMHSIEKVGLPLDDFLELCLGAMKRIAPELGL
jgi:predicted hydrolase (HD superfamily)